VEAAEAESIGKAAASALLVELLLKRNFYSTQCKKFRVKLPYRYHEIVKNRTDFTQL